MPQSSSLSAFHLWCNRECRLLGRPSLYDPHIWFGRRSTARFVKHLYVCLVHIDQRSRVDSLMQQIHHRLTGLGRLDRPVALGGSAHLGTLYVKPFLLPVKRQRGCLCRCFRYPALNIACWQIWVGYDSWPELPQGWSRTSRWYPRRFSLIVLYSRSLLQPRRYHGKPLPRITTLAVALYHTSIVSVLEYWPPPVLLVRSRLARAYRTEEEVTDYSLESNSSCSFRQAMWHAAIGLLIQRVRSSAFSGSMTILRIVVSGNESSTLMENKLVPSAPGNMSILGSWCCSKKENCKTRSITLVAMALALMWALTAKSTFQLDEPRWLLGSFCSI